MSVDLGVGHKPTGTVLDSGFRIGNMGHLPPVMLFGTLAIIDAGRKTFDTPHDSGALEAVSA